MFCTACGNEIREIDNHCPGCGERTARGEEARRQGQTGYYAPRRLTRLMYDKSVAGVCAGIAKYLDVDVTLVRIAVIAGIILSGGLGLLVYLGAWIIMPKDYGHQAPTAATAKPANG
jgi:phage shock protein PspC (stress-responsive transcriptional regulator)